LYCERKEDERKAYQEKLTSISKERLIYLDESGIEESIFRPYARGAKGQRVLADISGSNKRRYSIIAAYEGKRLISPIWFEGHTDSEVFNNWLENFLLPAIPSGKIIIMDNAAFHKSKRTKEIINKFHCQLLYLPTYSPDFNPIEQQWAILKKRVRKNLKPKLNIIPILEKELNYMCNHKRE